MNSTETGSEGQVNLIHEIKVNSGPLHMSYAGSMDVVVTFCDRHDLSDRLLSMPYIRGSEIGLSKQRPAELCTACERSNICHL